MRTNSKGNVVVLALLGIVIVLLAAALGYFVWQYQLQKANTQNPNTNTSKNSSNNNTPSVSMAAACSGLMLSKGSSNGTAGTIYWHAVITNDGSYDCMLSGYPAAYMSDAADVTVGAESNPLYAPVAVTITAHGGKGHVVLGLPDAGNFDPSTTACTAAGSGTLKLYLPGVTAALEASFKESACPGFTVTALQPGA